MYLVLNVTRPFYPALATDPLPQSGHQALCREVRYWQIPTGSYFDLILIMFKFRAMMYACVLFLTSSFLNRFCR